MDLSLIRQIRIELNEFKKIQLNLRSSLIEKKKNFKVLFFYKQLFLSFCSTVSVRLWLERQNIH